MDLRSYLREGGARTIIECSPLDKISPYARMGQDCSAISTLMSASTESEVKSKFPDCVVMKLHIEDKSPRRSRLLGMISTKFTSSSQELDLSLTINFSGEQEIKVPGGRWLGLTGGRATFGVKRGQLRFVLQNCKLPLEKTVLSNPFKKSIEVERQKTRSSEIHADAALNTRSIGASTSEGLTETATEEVFQIKKVGSEDTPSWIFETYGKRTILEGVLTEILLGTIQVDKIPCEITADFMVRGDDIQITWGEIGQTRDIHRNKLALIERAIVLQYIKPMIESAPICQGSWKYG